ncbi:hypothetical protein [Terrisporobacter sp.]
MNIKKSLSMLIILTTFFTGCSNYQVSKESIDLPDEATKQKTMTKVQNNVNEIIDKNYKYVLGNLGKPNAIAYWLDKNKINDLQDIDDIEKISDVNLVYLKDISNEDTNSSALYLQLKDNKIKNAQIVDYTNSSISESLIKSKIIINYYTDGDIVKLEDLNKNNLDNCIGINSNDMEKIVGNKKVSYDAYLFDKKNKSISVYKLDQRNKLLAIFTENNKVSKIEIIDNKNEVISTIKNMIVDK